jgi:cbb3-type cytochrome oxidase subunit 3
MMGIARGIVTAVLLIAFVAMTVWVASKHNKSKFEAAARLPLEDDAVQPTSSREPFL